MPTASSEVIRMTYKGLESIYHPDVFQGNKHYAEEKMRQINEAYRVLSSPVHRQEYDKSLRQAQEQISQSYQASNQRKRGSERWKRILPVFLVVVFIILILYGLRWLDNAGLSNVSQYENEYQSVENTSTEEKILPPIVNIPQSGEFLSGFECFDESELTITADGLTSYVVKLKSSSGVERLSFYVRAGDTVTVGVPTEHMYVYFASGATWYGSELLFGDDTYYSMDKNLLDFSKYTWEYTLYPITSGNFSETPIDPSEF